MKDRSNSEEIEQAVLGVIERGLAELNLSAPVEAVTKLTDLVRLVSDWADRISLTGYRDPIDLATHLVLDAVALSEALPELDPASHFADLGSGIGFPGIPIAILRPSLETYLVESRRKRHHLQRELRRQLKLTRVIPILGRSEQVEALVSDVVVAQAMTKPREALGLMRAWTRPGGLAVLPTSDTATDTDLPLTSLPDEYSDLELRAYRVPISGRARKLWVARLTSR